MSIDRRSFVRTAAAAVGGAASFAGDAAAQDRLQLAQAGGPFPLTAPLNPPTGPYKPPYPDDVGNQTQRYYNFLKELFDPTKTVRDDIWNMSDVGNPSPLRVYLQDKLGLALYGDYNSLRILIVDIEKGRVKFADNQGCDISGCKVGAVPAWYTMVLPPLPLEHTKANGMPEDGYLHEKILEAAWHHAVVYGYGM